MYMQMSVHLLAKGDSIIIFDLNKKRIEYYSLQGTLLKEQDIAFDMGAIERMKILQDDATERLYVCRRVNTDSYTIEGLNMQTGELFGKQMINRPFAEDVKIHNGNVYFLWQDARDAMTRQLFVQN